MVSNKDTLGLKIKQFDRRINTMAVRLLIASVAIGIMVTISGCDKNKSKETNSVEYKS